MCEIGLMIETLFLKGHTNKIKIIWKINDYFQFKDLFDGDQ